jgi:N-methylhydantoinase A/oxoprolinase/acetone carboxylase beta subunit
MPAMKYFLAVDAGGTKTDYLLADEDAVLARVRTGSIKRMKTDAATAAANLDRALAELSSTSGTPMSAITCTCIGTAGEQVPLVTDWLREAFAERVAGKLLLLGDVEMRWTRRSRASPVCSYWPEQDRTLQAVMPLETSQQLAAGDRRSLSRVRATRLATKHSAPSF